MSTFNHSLTIISNEEVAQDWYLMVFSIAHVDIPPPLPGQFISLAFPQVFFRRPFAVSDSVPHKSFSILYQIQHRDTAYRNLLSLSHNATTHMSRLIKGDKVDVLGFHGNSFYLPTHITKPILVGGGIGLGPLLFFMNHTLINRTHLSPLCIVGARNSRFLPLELLSHLTSIRLCTDDGSAGTKGSAIDMLEQVLQSYDDRSSSLVYFCGPFGMMKKGAEVATRLGVESYASLDSVMACAMGSCMGCVAPIYEKKDASQDASQSKGSEGTPSIQWKRTCIEGPIFHTKDIAWHHMTP